MPLLQQMRQLQVKAMDVHHIMANGSMARQADLEGVTGEIYWHEGPGRHLCRAGARVLKAADIKLFDYLWTMGRMDAYLVMIQAIERAGAVDREKVAAELRKPGAVWKRPGGEFEFNDGGLSQIVSYTHQMQKGEPVVVWPHRASHRQDDLAVADLALSGICRTEVSRLIGAAPSGDVASPTRRSPA